MSCSSPWSRLYVVSKTDSYARRHVVCEWAGLLFVLRQQQHQQQQQRMAGVGWMFFARVYILQYQVPLYSLLVVAAKVRCVVYILRTAYWHSCSQIAQDFGRLQPFSLGAVSCLGRDIAI